MKKFQKNLLMCIVLALSGSSWAGHYEGFVSNVFPYGGRVYIVATNGVLGGGVEGCTFSNNGVASKVYYLDPAVPFGRAMMATALAAKLSGRRAYFSGDSVCLDGSPFPGTRHESLIGIDLKG